VIHSDDAGVELDGVVVEERSTAVRVLAPEDQGARPTLDQTIRTAAVVGDHAVVGECAVGDHPDCAHPGAVGITQRDSPLGIQFEGACRRQLAPQFQMPRRCLGRGRPQGAVGGDLQLALLDRRPAAITARPPQGQDARSRLDESCRARTAVGDRAVVDHLLVGGGFQCPRAACFAAQGHAPIGVQRKGRHRIDPERPSVDYQVAGGRTARRCPEAVVAGSNFQHPAEDGRGT